MDPVGVRLDDMLEDGPAHRQLGEDEAEGGGRETPDGDPGVEGRTVRGGGDLLRLGGGGVQVAGRGEDTAGIEAGRARAGGGHSAGGEEEGRGGRPSCLLPPGPGGVHVLLQEPRPSQLLRHDGGVRVGADWWWLSGQRSAQLVRRHHRPQ